MRTEPVPVEVCDTVGNQVSGVVEKTRGIMSLCRFTIS